MLTQQRKFKIKFGQKSLTFFLPEKNIIDYELHKHKLSTPIKESLLIELKQSLQTSPLVEKIKKARNVIIVCDDYTRPTPTDIILPPLIEYLEKIGIKLNEIKILIAAGFHRRMTKTEKVKKYGKDIVDNFEIIHHDALNYSQLVFLGKSSKGIPIWINQLVLNADFVIGIGIVEIHPWAGFAGGTKIISPGVAGKKTIDATHAIPVLYPGSNIGNIEKNIFWETSNEIARKTKLEMVINVVLDRDENVAGIFAGAPEETHLKAIKYFRKINEFFLMEEPDIVIASANPKYQSWGQMAISSYNMNRIVKRGGTVIIAAAAPENFGDSTMEKEFYYKSLATEWSSPEDYWEKMKGEEYSNSRNACAFYRYYENLSRANTIFVSNGFAKKDCNLRNFRCIMSIDKAIEVALQKYSSRAKIAVIDMAGMILPRIRH